MISCCEKRTWLKQVDSRKCAARFFTLLMMCGFSSAVNAGSWLVQPAITVTEMSTDNVDLTSVQKTRDRITEIAPSISLARQGDKVRLNIDYDVQGVYYDKSDEHDSTFSQVNAVLDSELIDELFYTEFLVTRDQQIVSPQGPTVSNNFIITNNLTDSTAWQVSPYFRHRLSSEIAGELRYRFNKIDYSDGAIDDSKSDEIIVDIGSLGSSRGDEWQLLYQHNKIKYNSGLENVFSMFSLEVVEYLIPRFGLLARLGYEDNEYDVLPGQEAPKGSVWEVGFRWAPTTRRNLELRSGERYFGKTYSLNMTGSERLLNWSVAYSELPMSTVQMQFEQQTRAQGGVTSLRAEDVSPLNTAVYIRKYFTSMVAVDLNHVTFSLSVFKDHRDYQAESGNEVSEGAVMAVELQPYSRTSVIVEHNWHKQNFGVELREDKVNDSEIALAYMISPRVTGEISVGRVKRDSTNNAYEYSSNMVAASLEYLF